MDDDQEAGSRNFLKGQHDEDHHTVEEAKSFTKIESDVSWKNIRYQAPLAMYNNKTKKVPLKSWKKLQDPPYMNSTAYISIIRSKITRSAALSVDIRLDSLIVASNLGYLFTMHAGINLAFSNLLLNEYDNEITSWFASIVGISTPIGSCLSGSLMDKFGRKKTNLVAAFPCVLSWILIYRVDVDQIWLLYFARFLAGIAGDKWRFIKVSEPLKYQNLLIHLSRHCALVAYHAFNILNFLRKSLIVSNIVYVSEISHKKFRPVFLSLLGFYFSLGILLTTVFQACLTWRQTALFNAFFFMVAFVLIAIFTPESPVWLANFRSDWPRAKRSLRILIADDKVFLEEWIQLQNSVRSSSSHHQTATVSRSKLLAPAVRKPIVILLVLFLLQQSTGIYAVIMYALKVFPKISPYASQFFIDEAFVLFGVLRFISSIVSSLLSVRVGRRMLLMSSSVGMACCCGILAISVGLQRATASVARTSADLAYESTSLIMFLAFVCFGTYGVVSIPWTLIVELLPNSMRSVGSAAMITYGYLLMFAFAKAFPFLVDSVDVCLFFGILGFISGLNCVFVYYYVPETLGKSFNEIESYFRDQKCSHEGAVLEHRQ